MHTKAIVTLTKPEAILIVAEHLKRSKNADLVEIILNEQSYGGEPDSYPFTLEAPIPQRAFHAWHESKGTSTSSTISAIKAVRAEYGWGLGDSKAYVDRLVERKILI